jgi:hypothetical protein
MEVKPANKPVAPPAPAPKRPVESQQAQERQSKSQESARPKVDQPAPKPVINTQGQVTGRHLNVSA